MCRCRIHDPLLLFLSIRLSISSFLHSFHLSRQYKGVSRPVPSRNPSLHLGVCVCFFFFFLKSFLRCRLFSSISKSVFSSPSCSLTFSLFFSTPLYFEVAGKLVFRSVGIAIASPSQLESGSHSTAHKHTRRYAHFFLFAALFVRAVYADMWCVWSCTHGCLTCKDAWLVGAPGCFSSGFCLFIILPFICFSPSSNKS